MTPYDAIAQDIATRAQQSRVLWLFGLGAIGTGPTAYQRESYRAFHTSIDASMDLARALRHVPREALRGREDDRG